MQGVAAGVVTYLDCAMDGKSLPSFLGERLANPNHTVVNLA